MAEATHPIVGGGKPEHPIAGQPGVPTHPIVGEKPDTKPVDKPSPKVEAGKKNLEAKQEALTKAAEAQAAAHLDYTNAQRELIRLEAEDASEKAAEAAKEAEVK